MCGKGMFHLIWVHKLLRPEINSNFASWIRNAHERLHPKSISASIPIRVSANSNECIHSIVDQPKVFELVFGWFYS
jgi:hypothetical protein